MENAPITAALAEILPDLDESLAEYLTGVITTTEDFGENGCELVEVLAPFLESYGVADSEEEAQAKVGEIYRRLEQDGQIPKADDDAVQTLVTPISAIELDNTDDDWGLKDVKVKNKANVQVESIMSKQEIRRRARKDAKEKRKEDIKLRQEEEEIRKMRDENANVCVSSLATGYSSQNKAKDVNVDNYTMSIGAGKELLADATLKIVSGRKYGLIGRNGVGKTTLLKNIARRQVEGFPSNLSVLHVEQEVVGDDTTVLQCVLRSDARREAFLAEEKRLNELVDSDVAEDPKDGGAITDKLRTLYEEMIAYGTDSAESNARKILTGLSFPAEKQEAPTSSLSGGWRMRVAIASALYLSPDILMLDEPTNHLDLEACVWLERYLVNYPNTILLVSHDRKFTNNVITDVIHFESKLLHYYRGDIDVFEETRARQRLEQQRAFESQQMRVNHMQKFIDKFRFNASRASLVQSRIKALKKLNMVDEVMDDPLFQFSFPQPISELSRPILQVDEVSFGYPAKEGEQVKLLFENANFGVDTDSRIAILGPNGCGKSTMLNVMLGDLDPVSGYVMRNGKLRIANFAQHHVDQIDLRATPLEYMLSKFPGTTPVQMRPHLARYGIPADLADQRIMTLSGGQKSRVAFAHVTFERPHILILDEPTNHLDLETVEALIMAVSTFEGGVVLVSHDQHFISMCAEEFWVISDKQVTQFKGTFDEYKTWAMPVEK